MVSLTNPSLAEIIISFLLLLIVAVNRTFVPDELFSLNIMAELRSTLVSSELSILTSPALE